MGRYLNPGDSIFRRIKNDKYVDKSLIIELLNNGIDDAKGLVCMSRPRRFGKSYTAGMLAAYYDCSVDSSELFGDLRIAEKSNYEKYLNQFNVIYLDVSGFISEADDINDVLTNIKQGISRDIYEAYPDITREDSLTSLLVSLVERTGRLIYFIIDEWDALFREVKDNQELQKEYVTFLRGLFKNGNFTGKAVAGAFMTGILPIKKYGTQSAISDFDEYTMTLPGPFAGYIGFTEEEVEEICRKYGLDLGTARRWYDGYHFGGKSVYNPNSLMSAIRMGEYNNYWGKTESYESIIPYIEMNYDGLKEDIIALLGAGRVPLDVMTYQNDMTTINSKDDVLTLLIHLGYLGYDADDRNVYVPNEEVRQELYRAVKGSNRAEVIDLINRSDLLYRHIINGDEEEVADIISEIHDTGVAPLYYNDEQSLRYVVRFALISIIDYYVRIEELPTGHGYADIVYLPKRDTDKKAMLIELKWDKDVESAIDQIHENNYPSILREYGGDYILVGITYDVDSKKHICKIERMTGA